MFKDKEKGQVSVGAIAVVIVVAVIVAFFCALTAYASTPADKVGVVYNGGPLDSKDYRDTLHPGSGLTWVGVFSHVYEYPTTQRTYIVDESGQGDVRGSIHTVTKDGVKVGWEANTYFKLNTSKLKQFQNNIGFKYSAHDEKGWDRMLNDTFRPQIESALQAATRNYDVQTLFSDPKALAEVQDDVAKNLKDNINSVLGDEYFCGPAYVYGEKDCPDFKFILPHKPSIPQGIENAFERNKASQVEIQTKANEVKQKEQEAKGIKLLAAATAEAGPAYIQKIQADALMEAAHNGSSIYVPFNSQLILPGK